METKKTTTKEAAKKPDKENSSSGRKKAKRPKPIGDCPIGVGGGSGLTKRSFPIGGITICLPLDETEVYGYKKDTKDSHKYSNKNLTLRSLEVVDEDQTVRLPPLTSNSQIVIACSNIRYPDTETRTEVTIRVKPLGIKFTDDWAKSDTTGCFHSSYLAIREIRVDNHPPYKSPRGRCTLVAHSE